jgi:hypothetical protein
LSTKVPLAAVEVSKKIVWPPSANGVPPVAPPSLVKTPLAAVEVSKRSSQMCRYPCRYG